MKFFSLLLLCYLAIIAQLVLVPEMSVAGSRPHLPLVVLCLALFWLRDAQVFVWAILTGIICETFDNAHPGTGVLVLTGLCWLAFRIQMQFELRSLVSRSAVMLGLAFTFECLFQMVNRSDFRSLSELSSMLPVSAGNAVYTAVVGLVLLLICKMGRSLWLFSGNSDFATSHSYTSRYSH
ncbi:hypothetical protein Pan153_05840 [Gimesia panareensis]|uniref:Uncharacterized protein n=1 Tax=Gimesia panareensis TaxID=2527978 RepID=A0A518FHY2_9PLAN|nr:rod shape-determining protein MreD [Gimesia panareensis]QDV15965.1 hypothetical protein Pan153_05840 [Gimesia panareensis]